MYLSKQIINKNRLKKKLELIRLGKTFPIFQKQKRIENFIL